MKQGQPVHFRVAAKRPATGRLESEALATVRVYSQDRLADSVDTPHLELRLEWSQQLLRYVGRSSTEGWALGKHTVVAEVRDVASSDLLGGDTSTIEVVPAI